MKFEFVQKTHLGRMGCMASIGYVLRPDNPLMQVLTGNYYYPLDDADAAVMAIKRMAQELDEVLDRLVDEWPLVAGDAAGIPKRGEG